MKNYYIHLCCVFLMLFSWSQTEAQCTYDNSFNSAITLTGTTTSTINCVQGGQYVSVPVTSGETYSITTCNSAGGGDSQITLFNSTNTAISVGYNDDDCGLFSTITYVATFTGTLYIQVSEFNCTSSTTCYTLDVTCTSCGGGGGGASCSYQLDMFDSYGDGWDGSTVDVSINGILLGSYTVTGTSNTVTFSANNCDVVSLAFTSGGGAWDSEVSYNLYEQPDLLFPIFTADYFLTVTTGPVFYGTCGTGCGGSTVNNVTCDSMAPICTDAGATFNGNVSGTDAILDFFGPNYDCLISAPDPTYWYFEVSQSGVIDMSLVGQGDVDFIIWGPYTDLAAAQATCGAMGTGGVNGSVIDCSYDPTSSETPSIPSAVVGQVYIMMITNFAGVPQDISLTQTGGLGATDCSIVTNCTADAGTSTTTINGNLVTPGNPAVLCWGECIDIQTDSNFVLPPPVVGETPELMYAIYTAAPDPAIPDPGNDPNYSGFLWTGDNFQDCNDATSTIVGAGLGPQVWFVPVTMDDGDDNGDPNGIINWDNSGDSCWALGTPIEIAFLDSITATINDNCQTVSFTLAGGYPGLNPAGTYTVANTGPGTMTQSGANGEIITFSGFTPGQTVSFDVSNDGNSCFNAFSYTTNVPASITLDNIVNANCGATDGAVNVTVAQTPCTFIIDMFDSYGDGWNGAQLDVTVNGVAAPGSPFGATFGGFSDQGTFSANPGDVVVFTYTAGAWEGEVTYDIYQDGNLAFSDGPNPATGVVFTTSCPPYTYSWSNGASTEDITNIAAGSYTLTVTDGNGCTSTSGPHTVTETGGVTATIASVTDVACNGDLTGAVNINNTGGVTPYVYNWSNGATSQNISGVGAGTYTVTVVDNNGTGCTSIISATVNAPTALTASAIATDAACNGAIDGSVDLTVGGGTTAYTFLWSNGATSEDLAAVAAGTYTVTATDANGCTITSSATVGEPTALTASATATDAACNGANGSVDLTVGGGTTAYTFLWSNGATSEDLTAVAAGTYTVTATDANGCTITSAATVGEPTALTASATATDAACNGATDGSVDLTVGGGTTAYTFLWSNGATSEDLTAVAAGTYSVTATDANGCTITSSATVGEPTALTASATATDAACNGANGSVDLTVGGGTTAYTFLWDNGATTEDLTNVAAGTYNVTATDANGCTITSSATVGEPTAITASTTVVDAACGGSNGSIDLTVSGGSPAYTFLWDNGATTEDISGLPPGSYNVTITDGNGCTVTSSGNVNTPSGISLSTTSTDVACNSDATGGLDLTASGGTMPYTFAWSNGAATEDISNVVAGIYTVTITDATSCVSIITDTITENPAITVSATSADVDCNAAANGSIDLTVGGGSPTYTFLWDNGATTEDLTGINGGTYNVTVTDNLGCQSTFGPTTIAEPTALAVVTDSTIDETCTIAGGVYITVNGGSPTYSFLWSDGSTNEDLTGVTAGSYTVTITDANGCSSVQGPETVNSIGTATATLTTSSDVSCNAAADGSIDITVTGGTAPYTFIWDNAATTEDLTGLSGGTYNVTVTDGLGCQTTLGPINIAEPTALSSSAITVDVDCNAAANGSINISVVGGTTPYSFLWDNGATTEDLTGLSGGTYNVTATDANGCTIVDGPYTINEPTVLAINNIVTTDASCAGGDGAIDITVGGGTAGYTYNWDNGATSEDLTGLNAGSYVVDVTDANGCSATTTVTIASGSNVTATLVSTTDESCAIDSSGSIDITVSGGSGPYTFAWDNGATTEDLANISGGTYTVTATDANGCDATITATINNPVVPVLNATIASDSMILGDTAVALNAGNDQTAQGVVYNWTSVGTGDAGFGNTSDPSTTVQPDEVGDYNFLVTATSADGCVAIDSVNFVVTELNDPQIPSAFTPNGDDVNETFKVLYLESEYLEEFKIFNRWGEVIYDHTVDGNAEWDGTFKGTAQPSDAYIYLISWQLPADAEATVVRGSVTLLR